MAASPPVGFSRNCLAAGKVPDPATSHVSSCPSVDTIVVIAGLFRALVERESTALPAGTPATVISPTLGRAAIWRAARSGLEGELIDVNVPVSRPAADVVAGLVASLRPQLEDAGDWPLVSTLTRRVLAAGSSAARQRWALCRRGRLTDVVDQLMAETADRGPESDAHPESDVPESVPAVSERVELQKP